MKKRTRGQPTKYDPKYCEMLIEHMKGGLSFESFAGVVRVNLDTLYEWAKVHPEFSEAKKVAFQVSRLWWEKQGIDGLWNTFQGTNLSPSIWIYNMKCRFPKEWRDDLPPDGSKAIGVFAFQAPKPDDAEDE